MSDGGWGRRLSASGGEEAEKREDFGSRLDWRKGREIMGALGKASLVGCRRWVYMKGGHGRLYAC